MAGDFITCDNKNLSIEDIIRMLLVDDGTGCPQLNTTGGGGGGASITFDFELNCVIDTVTDVVYLMRVKEEEDGTITIDYINAQGAVVVPPNLGDLAICNANDALLAILAELEVLTAATTVDFQQAVVDGATPAGVKEISLQFYGTGGTLNGVPCEDGKVISWKSAGGSSSIPYTVPTAPSAIDLTQRITILTQI